MAADRLTGRVVIVTGAASGIGLAAARLFAAEGASVALVDRDGAALGAAAAGLGAALAIEADVSDAEAAAASVARVLERWGRIDALVTAAAISVGKRLGETTAQEWDAVFAVNVRGTFLCIRSALPAMVAARSGAIVTVASQLALAGGRQSAAYVASKGAILSLTRSVAVDYAELGIRANTLVPGAIETPFLERGLARAVDPQEARASSKARHAMGRFGTADEVARAALFLVSDESTFTTGAELRVDGGWLAS
jgi:2-keto-3-deoxy-L-fuconate dehydrogenase